MQQKKRLISSFGKSIALALVVLLYACATPRMPEGGPKDEQAPSLRSDLSDANFQTNFAERSIQLTFDEWVKLQDAFNQVVVSPPLEFQPDVRLKRKTVFFTFDEQEVLRPDATYTINFGDAIQDITENNPAEDLRYVFSTGDQIDSLQLSGNVRDLLTAEPVEEVLVMLYENTQDSVVRTERPFYFAKTDAKGNFSIQNIKAGSFKIFALQDANRNYLYDQETESIAFENALIQLPDTTLTSVSLQLFTEEPMLRLLQDDAVHYGLTTFTFNRPPYDVQVDFINSTSPPYQEVVGDTLKIWYDTDTSFEVLLQADTLLEDTVRVAIRGKDDFLKNAFFYAINAGFEDTKSKNPFIPMGIEMNYPIADIDTSQIKVYRDTSRTPIFPRIYVDSVDKRLLKMDYTWKEKAVYQVEILPGGLTSFWGIANDSIVQSYKMLTKEDFGTYSLTIDSLQNDQHYIVQLLTANEDMVEENILSGVDVYNKQYDRLPVGAYQLKVIEDSNQNGRWDTGSYDEKRQAERFFIKNLEALRANWTVEAQIEVVF